MLYCCILRGDEECERVVFDSTDDFYYFRDSIHNALEIGEFGSRFPTFMRRFEPAEWSVEEIGQLERELETIAEALRRLIKSPGLNKLSYLDFRIENRVYYR